MEPWNKIKSYRFEIHHFLILFLVIILFQTLLSYINTTSTRNLLSKTMDLYRKDSAESMADLMTTSLEMLLEHDMVDNVRSEASRRVTVRDFNIILSQQTLQQNVSEICVLLPRDNRLYAVDDGSDLYAFVFDRRIPGDDNGARHAYAMNYYRENMDWVRKNEQIFSSLEDGHAFHILVPLVPMGEYMGAVYFKIDPDFSRIAREITTSYNETGAIFSALILLGLLANFYITSYLVRERDAVQNQLFTQKQIQIKKEIEHEKEAAFTRRIYHTHHKAEKVMGFIKQDIRDLSQENLGAVKMKISKYANFIGRVIYDMKSHGPPLHVIRNPIFRTDPNEVIRFIVQHIFKRVHKDDGLIHFHLDLDGGMEVQPVNEYVVWEIIEPLIQNSIDHNRGRAVSVTLKTRRREDGESSIQIRDDGAGIDETLLQMGEEGIRKIFLEHTSTKDQADNSGYGCFLAHQICRLCGWRLEAGNSEEGGACFIITIPGKGV